MLFVIIMLALITVFSVVYLAITVHLLEEDAIPIRLRAINNSFVQGRNKITAALTRPFNQRIAFPLRLSAIYGFVQGCNNITATLARPFKQRIAFPPVGEIASRLNRFKAQDLRSVAKEKIGKAAGFGRRNAYKFLLLYGVLACGFPVVIVMFLHHMGTPAKKSIGIVISTASIVLCIPFLLIIKNILVRKASMQKALPDVLDHLTVSVEAGLDFDAAVAKLAEQMKGPLVDEFIRLLQDIHMGIPRQDALQAMGIRCGRGEVSLLITAFLQADQTGESIGNVLRGQSAAIREQRRQRAEEHAQKAKILFLLALWTLTAIFVVLLVWR